MEPDASDLGFDVKENERLDLTVVATLPGGGESRWTYRNITFSGCSWSLNVVGSSRAGDYSGSYAVFMVMGERTTLSIGGTGADGNIITVTFPTVAPGASKIVDVGMKSSSTRAAAAFGFMGPAMATGDLGNLAQIMLATGDGSSVRGRDGRVIDQYPPAARLEVTRSSSGAMTGRLRGKAWAHRTMQDMHLVKPDVDLRFSAREWLSDVVMAGPAGRMPSFDEIALEPCGG